MFIHVTVDDSSNALDIESIHLMALHLNEVQAMSQFSNQSVDSWITAPSIIQLALDEEANGEKISDIVNNLKDQKLLGIILSCVSPENYELNINEIKNIDVPFGFKLNGYLQTKPLPKPGLKNKDNEFVQPNKFLGKREDLTPERMLKFVKKFKDAGATILGGCCETSPSHIKAFTSLK